MNIPFPEVCHKRLVLFFTDFAVSIVPALVSATHRGDMLRWVILLSLDYVLGSESLLINIFN